MLLALVNLCLPVLPRGRSAQATVTTVAQPINVPAALVTLCPLEVRTVLTKLILATMNALQHISASTARARLCPLAALKGRTTPPIVTTSALPVTPPRMTVTPPVLVFKLPVAASTQPATVITHASKMNQFIVIATTQITNSAKSLMHKSGPQ